MELIDSFLRDSLTRGSILVIVLLGVLIIAYMGFRLKKQVDNFERKVDVIMIILDRASSVGKETEER